MKISPENKEKLIEKLKFLPKPLVGSLSFDHKEVFNLRDSCIEMIEDVINISQPKEILEIGTHLGHSSCLFLGLSNANLTSVDICQNWVDWDFGKEDWTTNKKNGGGLKEATEKLNGFFESRFRFIKGDSNKQETFELFSDRKYDLNFIDGDHSYTFVLNDILNAIKLNIKYILLDDFNCTAIQDLIRQEKDLPIEFIKEYKDIHNTANISCGFFINKNI